MGAELFPHASRTAPSYERLDSVPQISCLRGTSRPLPHRLRPRAVHRLCRRPGPHRRAGSGAGYASWIPPRTRISQGLGALRTPLTGGLLVNGTMYFPYGYSTASVISPMVDSQDPRDPGNSPKGRGRTERKVVRHTGGSAWGCTHWRCGTPRLMTWSASQSAYSRGISASRYRSIGHAPRGAPEVQ